MKATAGDQEAAALSTLERVKRKPQTRGRVGDIGAAKRDRPTTTPTLGFTRSRVPTAVSCGGGRSTKRRVKWVYSGSLRPLPKDLVKKLIAVRLEETERSWVKLASSCHPGRRPRSTPSSCHSMRFLG